MTNALWNVKMRRDNVKSFTIVQVYARNRREARVSALKKYERTNGIDFTIAACEATKVKNLIKVTQNHLTKRN